MSAPSAPTEVATTRVPGALETHLRARRDAGHKLLVPYLTGGLGPWEEIVRAVS